MTIKAEDFYNVRTLLRFRLRMHEEGQQDVVNTANILSSSSSSSSSGYEGMKWRELRDWYLAQVQYTCKYIDTVQYNNICYIWVNVVLLLEHCERISR